MAAPMERLGCARRSRRQPSAGRLLAAFSVAWLRCFLGVQGREVAWTSLNDDLLLPYPPSQHGPQLHHRYVRDCQLLTHGNATHESWPGNNSSASPLAVTRSFVSYFPPQGQNKREVYGHFTVARNPLRTFSVLEPGGQGGCRSRTKATVEETARLSSCLVAQNGGYFDIDTGECFGNVVSDGKVIQTSRGLQNAQFGIRRDGTLVVGYLSEEEVLVKDNPFIQLVSGVVWLLRDGEVYVNQSRALECSRTQKTGLFDTFINTISARTAVGHDKEGRLVLVHVDGQTERRGLNLWEMARFLKEHEVVNAINLDGGGSATLVLNGTLASYPSDHCKPDPMWRCPRQITTIVCVHEPRCQPPDCSGHGDCLLGNCQCHRSFWTGPACDILDCGPSNCTPHGMCTEMGCLCDAGWTGSDCSQACTNGSYGDGCAQRCLCHNGGVCDPANGSCSCLSGYRGTLCEEECPLGWYGPNCQQNCQCPNQCLCDPITGSCNATHKFSVPDTLARVGECLLQAHRESEYIFAERTWIGITSVLAVLLLLSALGNARFFFCRSPGRPQRSKYAYQRLEEVNGEPAPTFSVAVWKNGEDGADEGDSDQPGTIELI